MTYPTIAKSFPNQNMCYSFSPVLSVLPRLRRMQAKNSRFIHCGLYMNDNFIEKQLHGIQYVFQYFGINVVFSVF